MSDWKYFNNNGTKSSTNLKTNFNNSSKKTEKKELYINTDFKDNSKNKLIFINNKENIENDKNKNLLNYNIPKDEEFSQTMSNDNKKELSSNVNYKNNIICFNNNIVSEKNSNPNSVKNTLTFNMYPLSRDNSKAYIKKKSSNININHNNNNGNMNLITSTNRSSIGRHKKNYSISSMCYNTQRNSKDTKFNAKDKNNCKNNYFYSPKNNKINNNVNTNKSIIVPEYKIKLDSIKSRVTDLLNVYSLLALRSINNSNESNNGVQNEESMANGHGHDI